MISFLSTQRKKVAVILLVIFISNLTLPIISYSKPMPGGGTPVSASLSNYVNPFTGDFNYSVPLMNVPGPNGESFPIALSYSAGIKMNQEASWIGLGWDFNPGEISRNVQGVPDDCSASLVSSTDYLPRIGDQKIVNNSTSFFGPLYFNEFSGNDYYSEYENGGFNSNGSMDVYQSNRMMGEHLFQFPNYDDYYLSGPGIAGQLTPNLFDFATLVQKGIVRETSIGTQNCSYLIDHSPYPFQTPIYKNYRNNEKIHIIYKHNYSETQHNKDADCKPFSINKKLQFRLKNEFPSKISAPIKYSDGTDKTPTTIGVGDYKVGTTDLSIVNGSKKMPAGTIVNFFTNIEIAINKSSIENFIDFQSTSLELNQGRQVFGSNPQFPAKGIGAFQVITQDGMTYHYSLPVYSKKNVFKTFTIRNDPNNASISNNFVDDENDFSVSSKDEKYAVSWKLTAITGPDFEDVNNNKIIDAGDKGYYVSFDYGLFKDNVYQRFPYYGFVADFTDRYEPVLGSRTHPKHLDYSYNRQGSVVESEEEHYYLNKISTSTHTALFIKDIRLDGHSKKTTTKARVPRLKLSKIILVKNEDLPNFTTEKNIYEDEEDRFDQNVDMSKVIYMRSYNEIKSQLDPVSLKTIDLEQDYSLCPNYFANVNFNNACGSTSVETFNSSNFDPKFGENYVSTSPTISIDVFDNFSEQTCNPSSINTGKLTLKSIRFKEKAAVPLFPSYEFDYDQENITKNPPYYPDQQDYWGNYKSDFNKNYRGHYVSNDSKSNVDAWSLKKIITPLGAEIFVTYESDVYNKVGYDGDEYDRLSEPQTTFLIRKVVSYTNTSAVLEFFDKDATKFITSESIRKYGLPIKCLEYPILINGISNVDQLNNRITVTYDNCIGTLSVVEGIKGYFSVNRPSYQSLSLSYGGGLRVSAISIKDNISGHKYSQEYTYEDGICTTEPDGFALIKVNNEMLHKSNFASDRHVVTPNVGYTRVTIRDKSDNNLYNGKTEIEFSNYKETYKPRIVSMPINSPNDDIYKNNGIEIKENRNTTYSLPLNIKLFDNNNNVISKTVNEYLTEKELEVSGARVEEAFHVKYQTAYHILPTCLSNYAPYYSPWTIQNYVFVKKQYTNVLKRQTVYQNDMKLVKDFLEFDALTGKPIRTAVTDPSEGVTIITETPAYKLNGNSELGSKLENPTYKNLLSLDGKKEIRKGKINYDIQNLNTLDEAKLIDGGVNTYSKTYLVREFNSTNSKFESNSKTSKWKLLKSAGYNGNQNEILWRVDGENSLFDIKGNLLENKKDNRFSAIKYGNNNRIIAKGKNTNYAGFLYSGFEEMDGSSSFFVGEVKGNSRKVQTNTTIKAHSGKYMLKIPPVTKQPLHNATVFSNGDSKGLIPGKTYIAKIWMHKDNAALAGLYVTYSLKKQDGTVLTGEKIVYRNDANNLVIGDWVLATLSIDIPGNIISWTDNDVEIGIIHNGGSTDSYFDDLVFNPIDAEVNGYVYDDKDMLSAEIDPNGLCTYYEYDAAGRAIKVYRETLLGVRKVSEHQYNVSR